MVIYITINQANLTIIQTRLLPCRRSCHVLDGRRISKFGPFEVDCMIKDDGMFECFVDALFEIVSCYEVC